MSDEADEESDQGGSEPGRGHSSDESAAAADGQPEARDVRSGDDQAGDPNGSRSQPLSEEIAAVEEIIDGEIYRPGLGEELTLTMTQSSWNGPLPPPDALEEYERICPGAANRVLSMAERNLVIRETREATVRAALDGQIHVQSVLAAADTDALKRGQYLAAGVSALVALLALAGMHFTPWSAVGFAVPLAQVAAALIRTVTNGSGSRVRDDDFDDEPDED